MALQANWDGQGLHVWGDSPDHAERFAHDALRGALAEISGDALVVSAAKQADLKLFVPDAGGAPQAVDVPTLCFIPADAIDLLAACCFTGGDAQFSDSLRFWATLARFVMRHIVEHQFFPDIELDSEHRWDPLESTCRHASLSIL